MLLNGRGLGSGSQNGSTPECRTAECDAQEALQHAPEGEPSKKHYLLIREASGISNTGSDENTPDASSSSHRRNLFTVEDYNVLPIFRVQKMH